MSTVEKIQYTHSFDVRKDTMIRVLPAGACLIDAYANKYLGVTVNFMASHRSDVEKPRLISPEESATGRVPLGYYRYFFRIGRIGCELPRNLSWQLPIKIEDGNRTLDQALYLFYALES